jgi:hypothetical protein
MSRFRCRGIPFGRDDNHMAAIARMTIRISWHRKLKRNAHSGIPGTVRQNVWVELQTAAIDFGLRPDFTRADVETAFRRLARKMHPDAGGTHDAFQNLITQRDLLLSQVRIRRLDS